MKESFVPSWLQLQPQMVNGGSGHGSPWVSNLWHCVIQSLPFTPTHSETADDVGDGFEEPVQRVESGKDLRAKIYAMLTRENLNQDSSSSVESPNVGWVNAVVKQWIQGFRFLFICRYWSFDEFIILFWLFFTFVEVGDLNGFCIQVFVIHNELSKLFR